ncbi:MAG: Sensor histidine kinase RcsC [Phycisphaerae bacterium]|nr:Sensor histidine kinase RcsC [Phycisphaerae bacterium]
MRLIRFSLAAKYRILFACAVLLIIGAALALPWDRVERLAKQQPFREAQRMSDDYFRLMMATPGGSGAEARGSVHSLDMSLLPADLRHAPAFVRANTDPNDAASVLNVDPRGGFAMRALAAFGRDRRRQFFHETTTEGRARIFNYAHAIRVEKRCLACHGEGQTATRYGENELAGFVWVTLPVDQSPWEMPLNRGIFIAAGLLAGLLAVLVFYVITHRFILSPIDELRGVAQRVTEGDIDVRSALQTGDEFEQLAETLNAMLERLRTTQDDLRRANRLLDDKLGEMAETNVALYEANRLKSEFLANVSHELRTPLTSIIGFAELLRESAGDDGKARGRRYAENILISGRILLEIINDLLDLAKIEAGRIELHIENVELHDVCTTLVDFMRPVSDKKNIALDVHVEPDLPTLRSDRGRLRQILFNLMSNAVKFTPEDGRVSLRAERAGAGRVRLRVADTGPGIDAVHQQMIFEKFRQIDGSATRAHQGTGLGLAIAKELTHMLGGEIGVESEPGAGATFWIELPESIVEGAPQRAISLV